MGITQLPLEIVEAIVLWCGPIEVGQLAQTCHYFRSIVRPEASPDSPNPSARLWKNLYLAQPLDDPRNCYSQLRIRRREEDIDWMGELQRLTRARIVALRPSLIKRNEAVEILKTFLHLVTNTVPMHIPSDDEDEGLSLNLAWAVSCLKKRAFLDLTLPIDEEYQTEFEQLHAQLHTYYGLTPNDTKPFTRIQARAYVYNLSNYNWGNEFGPFLESDKQSGLRVNWKHVKMLHHIVSMHNISLPPDGFKADEWQVYVMSMPYIQTALPEEQDILRTKDWAGVSGVWTVAFCFVDHRILQAYNEEIRRLGAADNKIFENSNFTEVYRRMHVHIQVTQVKYQPEHPEHPKLYFVGTMGDFSTSTMSGYVMLTADNQIQWSFISGEQGQAIWSSTGVQVGGLGSRFGVLGAWTTIFHDMDDPVGPFWLQKESELSKPPTDDEITTLVNREEEE